MTQFADRVNAGKGKQKEIDLAISENAMDFSTILPNNLKLSSAITLDKSYHPLPDFVPPNTQKIAQSALTSMGAA